MERRDTASYVDRLYIAGSIAKAYACFLFLVFSNRPSLVSFTIWINEWEIVRVAISNYIILIPTYLAPGRTTTTTTGQMDVLLEIIIFLGMKGRRGNTRVSVVLGTDSWVLYSRLPISSADTDIGTYRSTYSTHRYRLDTYVCTFLCNVMCESVCDCGITAPLSCYSA